MAGVNKVILVGHLGADPEARTFSNGNEVVNLRVATSESWKDRDGNKQERTEWHTVAIFNENLGRVAKNYLRKGSKCYLEGALQTRKWQDQAGADRYSTEIVLQKFRGELVLLDAAGGNRDNGQAGRDFDEAATKRAHGFDNNPDKGGDLYGGARDSNPDDRRGGGGGSRPQPAAFDTDLDDDVPF